MDNNKNLVETRNEKINKLINIFLQLSEEEQNKLLDKAIFLSQETPYPLQ